MPLGVLELARAGGTSSNAAAAVDDGPLLVLDAKKEERARKVWLQMNQQLALSQCGSTGLRLTSTTVWLNWAQAHQHHRL